MADTGCLSVLLLLSNCQYMQKTCTGTPISVEQAMEKVFIAAMAANGFPIHTTLQAAGVRRERCFLYSQALLSTLIYMC